MTRVLYLNLTDTVIDDWENIDPVANLPILNGDIYDEVRYLGSRILYPSLLEFVIACEHIGTNVRYIYIEDKEHIIDFKCIVYGNKKSDWTIITEEDKKGHDVLYTLMLLTFEVHKSKDITETSMKHYYNNAIKLFCDRYMRTTYSKNSAMCFLNMEDYRTMAIKNMHRAFDDGQN